MAGQRELVLIRTADAPARRRQGLVLAHRQSCTRLGDAGRVGDEVAGPDRGERLEPCRKRLRGTGADERVAQPVRDRHGRVGDAVGAAGDAVCDLAEADLVAHVDRRLEARRARLLQLARRGVGVERGAEHRLAGEVEVAAVLEDSTAHDLADPMPGQPEPGGKAVERGGQACRCCSPGGTRRGSARTGCGCRRRRRRCGQSCVS